MLQRLHNAVFVLESDAHMEQGTGFLVTNVGLITCAHVAKSDSKAFLPHSPKEQYSTVIRHIDIDRDVAVLGVVDLPFNYQDHLEVASELELELGEVVTLAGFANYTNGASISVKTAQISHVDDGLIIAAIQ